MEKLYAVTRIGSDRINVEIGPWDDDRGNLRFGWDAELTVTTNYWDEGTLKVEAGFASIGSLPVAEAAERARSYVAAAALGVHVADLIGNDGWSFGDVADFLSNPEAVEEHGIKVEFVWDPREGAES